MCAVHRAGVSHGDFERNIVVKEVATGEYQPRLVGFSEAKVGHKCEDCDKVFVFYEPMPRSSAFRCAELWEVINILDIYVRSKLTISALHLLF